MDIVAVLTDRINPNNYWKVLKSRLKKEGGELVTKRNRLKLRSPKDGKTYNAHVLDTKGVFGDAGHRIPRQDLRDQLESLLGGPIPVCRTAFQSVTPRSSNAFTQALTWSKKFFVSPDRSKISPSFFILGDATKF